MKLSLKAFLVFVFLLLVVSICRSAEERVINLPEDGGKWYVSIVGIPQNAQYQDLLKWFDSKPLLSLKEKTHFNVVTPDMAIFADRYKKNVKALPTVRVQDNDGAVIFESAGDQLPGSATSLYAAIADSVSKSEARLRRQHQQPQPETTKPQPNADPDPAPAPLDNGGAPILDPQEPDAPIVAVWLVIGLFVAGLVVGQIKRQTK